MGVSKHERRKEHKETDETGDTTKHSLLQNHRDQEEQGIVEGHGRKQQANVGGNPANKTDDKNHGGVRPLCRHFNTDKNLLHLAQLFHKTITGSMCPFIRTLTL